MKHAFTCWYLADVVLEHRIEQEAQNVVHVNTHLVKAGSPAEAYENTAGLRVRVVFRGLRELNVIHEPLEDGAEIMYTEDVGVPDEQLREWVRPRERLAVFAPVEPKRDGPNYLSESVLQMLEAETFSREDVEGSA